MTIFPIRLTTTVQKEESITSQSFSKMTHGGFWFDYMRWSGMDVVTWFGNALLDSPARSWTRPYLEDSGNLGLYTDSSCSVFLFKCPVTYRSQRSPRGSVRVHGSSESAPLKVRAFTPEEFRRFPVDWFRLSIVSWRRRIQTWVMSYEHKTAVFR